MDKGCPVVNLATFGQLTIFGQFGAVGMRFIEQIEPEVEKFSRRAYGINEYEAVLQRNGTFLGRQTGR